MKTAGYRFHPCLVGPVVGLLWSVIPGYFSELLRTGYDFACVFSCGALTGLAITFLVQRLDLRSWWQYLLVSPPILVIAGGLFGVLLSIVCRLFPLSHTYGKIAGSGHTLDVSYAFLWLYPPFPVLFVPLAFLSCWLVTVKSREV